MKEIPLLKPEDIEVKVKQIGDGWALALLYKTARVDMAILDEVFGAENWTNRYEEIKGNLFCHIGVRLDNGEIVWKSDCGIESRADDEGNEKKGEASDSFKRAGFRWGIGRELYSSPTIFMRVKTKLKDPNSQRKDYVLERRTQTFNVIDIEYIDRKITALTICDDKNEVVFSTKSPKKKQEVDELTNALCKISETERVKLDSWCKNKFEGNGLDTLTNAQKLIVLRMVRIHLQTHKN